MKTKEYILTNIDQYTGYDLIYMDIPVSENRKLRKDMNFFDRKNEINNSSIKKNIWVSNFKGMKENKYNKPIPLNKIGLLSENFIRMKKIEKQY